MRSIDELHFTFSASGERGVDKFLFQRVNARKITWDRPLQRIGQNSFYLCQTSAIGELSPTCVLEKNALAYSNITSLVFPSGINFEKWSICRNMMALEKVEFLGSVEVIGSRMFNDCVQLRKVTCRVPSSTFVRTGAFSNCSSLTELTGFVLNHIGTHAFERCKSLVEMPALDHRGVTLSLHCFESSGLKHVSLPKVKILPPSCFQDCRNLESVDLPHVKEIKKAVFTGCLKLTKISAPQLKTMGTFSFHKTGLQRIDFCTTFPSLHTDDTKGLRAFQYCEILTEVRIPIGYLHTNV